MAGTPHSMQRAQSLPRINDPASTDRMMRVTDPAVAEGLLRRIYRVDDLSFESRGPFLWTVAPVNLGPIGISRSHIEAQIELRTVLPFYLIHLTSRGVVRNRAGEPAADRRGIVGSPGQRFAYAYPEGVPCEALITRIDAALVAAQFEAMSGAQLRGPLRLVPELRLDQPRIASFERILRFFHGEIERDPGLCGSPVLMTSMGEMIVRALLFAQPHSHTRLLEREAPSSSSRVVAIACDYMEAHAAEPLRMADVAQVAGVSVRVLEKTFRAVRGTTPAAFLRAHRLSLAHRRLLTATSHTKVTAVAAEFGFLNVGRFCAGHRAAFGELPAETLRRALRAGGQPIVGTRR